jgi:hypothetical protein
MMKKGTALRDPLSHTRIAVADADRQRAEERSIVHCTAPLMTSGVDGAPHSEAASWRGVSVPHLRLELVLDPSANEQG